MTTEAWTENNDGKTLPSEMDASQHSGNMDATQHIDDTTEDDDAEMVIIAHDHKWQRGILPGQNYVKTCRICGTLENVTLEEWNRI